jgi:hypothetical protein
MTFTSDTAVQAVEDHYTAAIRPGWDIRGNANGGYLMALGARAMAEASRPHPVSVTAHFLSPGKRARSARSVFIRRWSRRDAPSAR